MTAGPELLNVIEELTASPFPEQLIFIFLELSKSVPEVIQHFVSLINEIPHFLAEMMPSQEPDTVSLMDWIFNYWAGRITAGFGSGASAAAIKAAIDQWDVYRNMYKNDTEGGHDDWRARNTLALMGAFLKRLGLTDKDKE